MINANELFAEYLNVGTRVRRNDVWVSTKSKAQKNIVGLNHINFNNMNMAGTACHIHIISFFTCFCSVFLSGKYN